MPAAGSVPGRVLEGLRAVWRPLVTADLAYKALAFVVFTPLSALLLRFLIGLSGKQALADQDILFFFLRPVGWLTLVAFGGLLAGMVALELAALMVIGFAADEGRTVRVFEALAATFRRAVSVWQVTARMIGRLVLVAAPFLAVVGVAYLALLTEHDINYYLTSKPPAYWAVLGIAVVAVAAWCVLALRMASGWFFALPLLLFEEVPPRRALEESIRRTAGHRLWIARWIVGWALCILVLSMALTGPIPVLGRWLVPRFADHLALLIPVLGFFLLLLGLANLAASVVGNATFGLLLVRLYRDRGDSYRVQQATNLDGDAWQDIGTLTGPATGGATFVDTNALSSQSFYRTVSP
ncbi:MAG: glycerophosphoryl diester phosphodiesterase membrane domain-containing protein [Anaerolineae bacterium]